MNNPSHRGIIIIYLHGVPEFLSLRRNWVPPPPPQARVPPPPLGSLGGATCLAGEMVGGPNSDEGTDALVFYLHYNPSTVLSVSFAVVLLFGSRVSSPDWGDKVNSRIGLSYQPVSLHRLEGGNDNPMPESTLSPQSETMSMATACPHHSVIRPSAVWLATCALTSFCVRGGERRTQKNDRKKSRLLHINSLYTGGKGLAKCGPIPK
jgi:hypothetical protein